MSEQITKTTRQIVSAEFLERAESHISCALLNMHDFKHSYAKVFTWKGKTWTGISSASRGQKLLQVEIREVVPKEYYRGPRHDATKRGPDFYLGGEFQHDGRVWVMTENEVSLFPDGSPAKPSQLNLFSNGGEHD